ncbi:SrtB family sortase [Eubacterium sp. 14-2]|uniref:class B sortase n=1 Tax=Eubacterium sp. 14-2 TaxID=1235790 RepID=UPI00033E85BE|nr:class B sortase [Eubacterium sp. 14-2]EOT22454.1 SrtB family sortase [Eubacterium sp. 14-2]
MSRVYCIGKFQFDSYEKYQEALDDIEKIRYISKKMDINEPGVAQRLYSLIREGKIIFKSVIGDDYLLYLSDMVAEDYKAISRTTFTGQITGKLKQLSPGQIAGAICMVGAVVCFLIFLGSEYHDQQKIRELEKIKDEQEISVASDWLSARFIEAMNGDDTEEEPVTAQTGTVENTIYGAELEQETVEKPQGPPILPEYQGLHEQNSDFAGWLTIPGTEIDYPVMQAVPESSDFYLTHNYDGQEDINGSIFLDSRNDYEQQDDNLIIYGHNMKSGMMFGGLKNYLDESYSLEHKMVTFNTIYEKAQYEIIAVCLSKVSQEGEEGIRYYDFINAGNEENFNHYLDYIKEMNIMSGDINASYGDRLLTLSTCNNYTEDGRLFLVAKKCSP